MKLKNRNPAQRTKDGQVHQAKMFGLLFSSRWLFLPLESYDAELLSGV